MAARGKIKKSTGKNNTGANAVMGTNAVQGRNIGIELFRIVSMLMIIILHINLNGNLVGGLKQVDAKFAVAWFGESVCYACVDCYALISGYVMYNHKASAGKLLKVWMQVFSISAITAVIFLVLKRPDVPAEKIIDSFRPLTKTQYWYFVAYFGMFLLIPVLNAAVAGMERLTHKKVCFLIFIFFTILPICIKNDLFRTSNGMSCFWLCLMYIVGAYFGKYGVDRKKYPPALCGFLGFLSGLILSVIVIWYSYKKGVDTGAVTGQFDWLFYTNPFVVFESVLLLMCFSQLKFKTAAVIGIIKWLAASSFSVYLIHVQPLVFDFVFKGQFAFLQKYNFALIGILAVMCAITIYIVCVILDNVRLLIFKLCRIDKLMIYLGERLDKFFTFILGKL